MALSEREQQLLDEMERNLYRSEADVVSASSRAPRRVNYRSLVLGVLTFVAGVGLLIGGVIAQQLWIGLIAFAVMLSGVVLMLSKSSDTGSVSRVGGASRPRSEKSRRRESLSERMERRWDQRMEGDL